MLAAAHDAAHALIALSNVPPSELAKRLMAGVQRQSFVQLRKRKPDESSAPKPKTNKLARKVLAGRNESRKARSFDKRDVGRRVQVLWLPPDAPADAEDKHLKSYFGTVVEQVRTFKPDTPSHLVRYDCGDEHWHAPKKERGLFMFV